MKNLALQLMLRKILQWTISKPIAGNLQMEKNFRTMMVLFVLYLVMVTGKYLFVDVFLYFVFKIYLVGMR